MHKEERRLLGDRSDLASRLGRSGRSARRSIDQRHLSENSPWAELLHDFAVSLDFDLAPAAKSQLT